MRILWRSWSAAEAAYELPIIESLGWHNGHHTTPAADDIWLTTNGYDYRDGDFKKITAYAESVNYLSGEYANFHQDQKWDHRFHFNPNYTIGGSLQKLGCWWHRDILDYHAIKNLKTIDTVFGMVLGHKPASANQYDFGWMRSKVVEACRDRSFRYYGSGWSKDDGNYGGEIFYSNRQTPEKFTDARKLLAGSKFVFCLENIYDKHYSVNYLTEKIFHGFLSYSVPIYAGCYNIQELIDPSLYIDLRQFDFDLPKVLNYCEQMPDSEYGGYLERIEHFLRTTGQEFTFNNRYRELNDKIRNHV